MYTELQFSVLESHCCVNKKISIFIPRKLNLVPSWKKYIINLDQHILNEMLTNNMKWFNKILESKKGWFGTKLNDLSSFSWLH